MTEAQKKILVIAKKLEEDSEIMLGRKMTTSSPEAAAPSAGHRRIWRNRDGYGLDYSRDLDGARQTGYDEGFEKGHAEGLAKAQAITADLQQLWEAMAQPFSRQEEALFAEQCLLVSRVAGPYSSRRRPSPHPLRPL